MSDRLIENISKVHTTAMGLDRIKNNLSLEDDNAVDYCKNIILNKESSISQNGKNWYIEYDNIRITVNSNSFTIITAHKSCNNNLAKFNDLIFTTADIKDITEIVAMYKAAIKQMDSAGIDQWDEIYPNERILNNDITRKELFIGKLKGRIVIAYVVNTESDDEYAKGKWNYPNSKYCILHRLCVNPIFQNRSLAKKAMIYVEGSCKNKGFETIRLDSFTKNPYAEKLYDKLGYSIVGQAMWRKGVFNLREKKL